MQNHCPVKYRSEVGNLYMDPVVCSWNHRTVTTNCCLSTKLQYSSWSGRSWVVLSFEMLARIRRQSEEPAISWAGLMPDSKIRQNSRLRDRRFHFDGCWTRDRFLQAFRVMNSCGGKFRECRWFFVSPCRLCNSFCSAFCVWAKKIIFTTKFFT